MNPPTMSTQIIASTAIIVCLTIAAVTLVTIYHAGDNTQLITNIVGFATVAITSLMAFLKSASNSAHLQDLGTKVDNLAANTAVVAPPTGSTTSFDPPKP